MSNNSNPVNILFILFLSVLVLENTLQASSKPLQFIRENFKDPIVRKKIKHLSGQWERNKSYYKIKPESLGPSQRRVGLQPEEMQLLEVLANQTDPWEEEHETWLPDQFSKPVI